MQRTAGSWSSTQAQMHGKGFIGGGSHREVPGRVRRDFAAPLCRGLEGEYRGQRLVSIFPGPPGGEQGDVRMKQKAVRGLGGKASDAEGSIIACERGRTRDRHAAGGIMPPRKFTSTLNL